jgi:alkanesulfonate monooxygenase SsuD/methylene tetrahydromethanopterin reductase-like flavin-dependent oxidoreductase (luciferase family)
MDIGLHLPQFQSDPALVARIARRAEEAGYASLWVSDHVLTPALPAGSGSLPA